MFRNETNYVLTNGVLLDGTEKMTPQTGKDIYIEGGRIGAVADAAALSDSADAQSLFVTPRNIDELVRSASKLIAYGIDLALHRGLGIEDIDALIE